MNAPILLLDAGNSRLKWALQLPDGPIAQGMAYYTDLAAWVADLAGWPAPLRVLGCNVAGPAIAEQLAERVAPAVRWLKPTAELAGLRNGYLQPGQLGADRWAAMLGARALCQGDAIVVMAGTAMTVDALTAEGDFLGGVIVPGFGLMRTALAQGTADLGLPDGEAVAFPRATGQAIVNGALLALAGTVESMLRRLEAHTGRPATVLLSGGDAARLAPLLADTLAERLVAVDNLVLRGLARLAFAELEP
ncbi:type III pantothenate kinase [Chitinimonas arctica]|uniref:Type III pantothenate kinase n=1 Tax=Chitinimonas arctica TaxID=2594795 RepID=A0A516SEH5_9NEIS|nr:type III pantothenate kinase [Chitinimonas arctica]QDQ26562.1 type III pantothenate kinase [Chitinimonas arctica]